MIYQAANGSPKRLPMAPRTVLGPGYTGWCLACLEAAVVSTGGRSRTPPVGSRRARRTAHSTLQQAIVALASRRLSQSFPPQAVWQAWTARYGRALPSRREPWEAAKPSQEGAARGPSGACRAAARRVGVLEGGPLARATVRVSGGYSLPDARGSRSRSRTCSPRPDYPGDGAVRPHGPPAFA